MVYLRNRLEGSLVLESSRVDIRGDDLSGVNSSVHGSSAVDVGSRGRGGEGEDTEGLHFERFGLVDWLIKEREREASVEELKRLWLLDDGEERQWYLGGLFIYPDVLYLCVIEFGSSARNAALNGSACTGNEMASVCDNKRSFRRWFLQRPFVFMLSMEKLY